MSLIVPTMPRVVVVIALTMFRNLRRSTDGESRK